MKEIRILYIEDNPGDLLLFRQMLKDSNILNEIENVPTAEKALKFLKNESPYESKPKIDMIILDVGLPGINGMQFLEKIKNPEFIKTYGRIPVVFLSGVAGAEIRGSYIMNAKFFSKPLRREDLDSIINDTEDFYYCICTLGKE